MKVRRIDFSPDEWLSGTIGLTDAERGVYIQVLMGIYSHGGPISIDHARKLCGRHFNAAFARLQKLSKLTVNEQKVSNNRAEIELRNASKRSENAQQNISKRWKNKALIDEVVLPSGDANHQPSTINHQKKDSEAIASAIADAPTQNPSDPVKALFDEGVRLLTAVKMPEPKARTLIGGWRKQFKDPAVMAAIVAARNELASNPIEFIAACLNHSKGNGNGRHDPAPRQSPGEKLFEGFARAADKRAARFLADSETDESLLDG